MSTELLHIGFGNILAINRVVALISPNSAPTKRLVQEAREKGLVVDMTSGRRTKSVIVADSGHIILAALTAETIANRLEERTAGIRGAEEKDAGAQAAKVVTTLPSGGKVVTRMPSGERVVT